MRIAFVNTRMPGMTFLARDLVALVQDGVTVDLYIYDTSDLEPEVRRAIEADGGRVERVRFPWDRTVARDLLGEACRRPLTMAKSLALAMTTIALSPREGIRALAVLPAALSLGKRIAASGADQVHGLWAGVPASTAYWIHRHQGIPFSFSGHAWDVAGRTRMLARKVAGSRGMVVCSQHARGLIGRVVPRGLMDRVTVVHHGVDLAEWSFAPHGDEPSPPLILAVGKLIELKGYRYLVEACGSLRARGLEFRCDILGADGGEGPALADLAGRLGVGNLVRLVGQVSSADVKTRMCAASVLAAPSIQRPNGRADGIPNVLLEAMAVGTPIVATDAGGLGEVIRHGETGLLARQRDAASLADALAAVLTDRASARRRAEEARGLIEKEFDARVVTDRFLRAVGLRREG